jgi:hypothetical protein
MDILFLNPETHFRFIELFYGFRQPPKELRMEIVFEARLAKFIEFVGEEIREKYSDELREADHELEVTLESAAILLAWFGLAGIVNDDGTLAWVSYGRLASPRALKD